MPGLSHNVTHTNPVLRALGNKARAQGMPTVPLFVEFRSLSGFFDDQSNRLRRKLSSHLATFADVPEHRPGRNAGGL
jgi:hypothetical protein